MAILIEVKHFLTLVSVRGCQPRCVLNWRADRSADLGYIVARALNAVKGQMILFFNLGRDTT